MKLFPYLTAILILIGCAKQSRAIAVPDSSSISTGLNEEYLNWSESVFRGYFGNEESRNNTLEQLKDRCHKPAISDAHSCYNLSVIYFYFLKNYEEAYKHSQRAATLVPGDDLYRDMYRQSAIKSNHIDMLKLNYPYQSQTIHDYTMAIELCKENKKQELLPLLENLVKSGIITKQVLSSTFSNCIPPEDLAKLTAISKTNPLQYSDLYYETKKDSHPYSGIWDTFYYTRKRQLAKEDKLSHNITIYWRDVLRSVASGDNSSAQNHLRAFLSVVRGGKNSSHLYTALERAAYLLIEQDEFFKGSRILLKEFGDKP